jgi:hypothetical protein
MNGQGPTDAQIAAALRAHLPERAWPGLQAGVSLAIEATDQDRPVPSVLGRLFDADPRTRHRTLFVAASLLLAMALASAAVVGALRLVLSEPTLEERVLDLTWNADRASQDWPGPARSEPTQGGPVVFTARVGSNDVGEVYVDPSGDPAPSTIAEVDITQVEVRHGCWSLRSACVSFGLAQRPEPSPIDPRARWIAYGIVVDTDGDGHPDRRFGVDNAASRAQQSRAVHRMWRTDLGSGTTIASTWSMENYYMDATFPESAQGHIFVRDGGAGFRFYVWASEIVDGEVVATDYAPDVGWIEYQPPETP